MQDTRYDYSDNPEFNALAIEWITRPEEQQEIEARQVATLKPAPQPVKPYTPEWVKGIVASDNYTQQDYARFQAELRRRKKTGLLQMMQQLLKKKLNP
jgi:hypothetical protein